MNDHIGMSSILEDYIVRHTRESPIAKRLRLETEKLPRGGMQTMPTRWYFSLS